MLQFWLVLPHYTFAGLETPYLHTSRGTTSAGEYLVDGSPFLCDVHATCDLPTLIWYSRRCEPDVPWRLLTAKGRIHNYVHLTGSSLFGNLGYGELFCFRSLIYVLVRLWNLFY